MQILMAPYIPINWEAECQRGALNLSQSKSAVVYDNTLATLLGFVAVIAIAATIWVTILYITSRRQARNNEPPGCDKGSYITIP
ncbi:unnamed protein product [Allacma fusca]|uniref:Uncharacterized protein n=1 Tax=Allacma fusca TaxID=39272 RepID=A0A8J2L7I1_9HEXA|nr:unnamed protein product [Allacma fusca]